MFPYTLSFKYSIHSLAVQRMKLPFSWHYLLLDDGMGEIIVEHPPYVYIYIYNERKRDT